jgi:hypothetical protein
VFPDCKGLRMLRSVVTGDHTQPGGRGRRALRAPVRAQNAGPGKPEVLPAAGCRGGARADSAERTRNPLRASGLGPNPTIRIRRLGKPNEPEESLQNKRLAAPGVRGAADPR